MKTKYTKEYLSLLVSQSTSVAGVIRLIGNKQSGGMQSMINRLIRYYEIPTDHFRGAGWSKGLTKHTSTIIANQAKKSSFTDEQILSENSKCGRASRIREAMIRHGKKYICDNGHEASWMNSPLTLHIDHINGIHNDNRLENLRFLCPNCHQQTNTWGNKKR